MNIKEVLFWIFLISSMILLIWNVFGRSPNEFIALLTLIFMIVMKMWLISDRQIIAEMKTRESFIKIKEDIDLIKKKLKI